MFLFPRSWEAYSEISLEELKNVHSNYQDGGIDFKNEIVNIHKKCYSLNKVTLKNFVIYFANYR